MTKAQTFIELRIQRRQLSILLPKEIELYEAFNVRLEQFEITRYAQLGENEKPNGTVRYTFDDGSYIVVEDEEVVLYVNSGGERELLQCYEITYMGPYDFINGYGRGM
jgi:hypothetical protein